VRLEGKGKAKRQRKYRTKGWLGGNGEKARGKVPGRGGFLAAGGSERKISSEGLSARSKNPLKKSSPGEKKSHGGDGGKKSPQRGSS